MKYSYEPDFDALLIELQGDDNLKNLLETMLDYIQHIDVFDIDEDIEVSKETALNFDELVANTRAKMDAAKERVESAIKQSEELRGKINAS